MDMLVVKGGKPLSGTVKVSGAKNASLPIMAASLAVSGTTQLAGVPELRDVLSMQELLEQLGMRVWRESGSSLLNLEPTASHQVVADYELVRKMRASVCVLGPLLASRGSACVSLPGGCNIGHRPIDLHLKGLAALGAEIEIQNGYIIAQAKQLTGARIYLGGPQGSTVTGTCNILSAAVLAQGTTVIDSAACEPEVVDLGNFLQSCGAQISGLGTSQIVVEGVEQLRPTQYQVIPDRIEAATWLIAAAITKGELTVQGAREADLLSVISVLEAIGIKLHIQKEGIYVDCRNLEANAINVEALPHPGFPTDVQAQLTALLSVSHGTSIVTDHVFPDRFMHAAELIRMGANIRRGANHVLIQGVPGLSAANVMASDLRASAALVLAALSAEGESTIRRIYHLDRGYEKLDEKLTSLGATVYRTPDTGRPAASVVRQPHWQPESRIHNSR